MYVFCCMFGSVSKLSETLLNQFTFYREVFFFCLAWENFCIFVFHALTGATDMYKYSILIEHKQECWKSLCWTVTPLHFICVFILPARGPLFMESGRTQITIPLKWKISFYYVQSFAMPLCTLTLRSVCFYSVSAEPMGIQPIPKSAKPFSSLFLSVTSLYIPLKHTHPCLVCRLGGTHHIQQRFNKRCTNSDCALWTCIKGHFWSWTQSDCMPKTWCHSSWPVHYSL